MLGTVVWDDISVLLESATYLVDCVCMLAFSYLAVTGVGWIVLMLSGLLGRQGEYWA